jgi:hypothetical protein
MKSKAWFTIIFRLPGDPEKYKKTERGFSTSSLPESFTPTSISNEK